MANSIDLGAICLGAALGYGLRNELKSAGSVCKNALLAAATVAASTTAAAVEGAQKAEPQQPQAPQAPQGNVNGNGN